MSGQEKNDAASSDGVSVLAASPPAETARLEQRVKALEAEVAELKKTLQGQGRPDPTWWKGMIGAFADDPNFEEAMRLGKKWRDSFRPRTAKRSRKKSQ
jgi:hypothetical protein